MVSVETEIDAHIREESYVQFIPAEFYPFNSLKLLGKEDIYGRISICALVGNLKRSENVVRRLLLLVRFHFGSIYITPQNQRGKG